MTLEEFHNGLRILMNLDFDDLVKAGAFHEWQADAWQNFRRDPFDPSSVPMKKPSI